jgi:serine/threonine-protein kinase
MRRLAIAVGLLAAPALLAPLYAAVSPNFDPKGTFCSFDKSGDAGWLCPSGKPARGGGDQNDPAGGSGLQEVQPPTRYTSLALSTKTLKWGAAWGYSTREEADRRALSECSEVAQDCRAITYAWNQCVSLATSPGGAYGYDHGPDRASADAAALGRCNSVGKQCRVITHPCSFDSTGG